MFKCSDIHAFYRDNVFCPLHKHLINTLLVVTNTSLIKRLRVVVNRLNHLLEYEDLNALILLTPLLHDIGKVLQFYQVKKSYILHELISGVIVYKLLSEFKDIYIPGKRGALLKIVVYPIINHHYALRDLKSKLKETEKHLASSTIVFKQVGDVIECINRELSGISIKEVSNIEETLSKIRNILEYFYVISGKTRDMSFNELKWLYEEIVNIKIGDNILDRVVNIHISAITGIVNVSDYLTASIERSGDIKAEFVLSVISSKDLELVRKLIKPCDIK